MKISIKKNKKPDLTIGEMICEKPLSEHLDDYEITKFLNVHSINCFVGKPHSGKTTLFTQDTKKRV
jgi:hypothetical protein